MDAPKVDGYHFGRIVIDGQAYHQDVIILPRRVLGGWWRTQGHVLNPEDLDAAFETLPAVLVVGQGAYGRMEVPHETRKALQTAGIELIALPTEEACRTYNRLCEEQTAAAALHLTC